MAWVGAILAAALGGYITTRFAKHPILVAALIGVFAVLGYTLIPV